MNKKFVAVKNYVPKLNLRETQDAISFIKNAFQKEMSKQLNLSRVSAPLIVEKKSGINDNLNGIEKPVSVHVKDNPQCEVIHSLAKWKRFALYKYNYKAGEGIITDMNALRPDEDLSHIHSVYVDQWDWEKVISQTERSLNYLKEVVKKIYISICTTEEQLLSANVKLGDSFLPKSIFFIHSQELADLYPKQSPKERENLITKEKGAVFIIGIGANLKEGIPHDGRASDYDDWISENEDGYLGLNGDLLVWHPILEQSIELSSMGIRVNKESLLKQLKIKNQENKKTLFFHEKLLNNKLPLTIGGGIGQSRLCMLLLKKAHIGEVQSSVWSEKIKSDCAKYNIMLL